jgi:hypothetical protein
MRRVEGAFGARLIPEFDADRRDPYLVIAFLAWVATTLAIVA